MRKFFTALVSAAAVFVVVGVVHATERIVIADRGLGTISIIDSVSDTVVDTLALPAGENPPEPMYVVFALAKKRVFVGDRANNRVVAFDTRDFSVAGTVEAGAGVFHMWADLLDQQLWVNNDIDNTATVIDPRTLEVITTVPMPADLVAQGGRPHDVILEPFGGFAYVTMLGFPGAVDYVIKFSTKTFQEVGRAAVGKDPHVSLARQNNLLYVPSQNSNVVIVLDRDTLSQVAAIPVPGAHGAGMAPDGNVFYTTNLPGGGTDGLFTIDTGVNMVIESVDTPFAVPHNIALTSTGQKLYLTHSGATADKVTVYTIPETDPVPVLLDAVTVGLNPFGLAAEPPQATIPHASGKAVGVGRGENRGNLQLVGRFRLDGELDLSAFPATVLLTSLLDEEDGSREAVEDLPLTLSADPRNRATSAIFKTAARARPFAELRIAARSQPNEYTFRLKVSSATITAPSLCPGTTLGTSFSIDDGMTFPVTVSTEAPWRCFKRGNNFEYLRTP